MQMIMQMHARREYRKQRERVEAQLAEQERLRADFERQLIDPGYNRLASEGVPPPSQGATQGGGREGAGKGRMLGVDLFVVIVVIVIVVVVAFDDFLCFLMFVAFDVLLRFSCTLLFSDK